MRRSPPRWANTARRSRPAAPGSRDGGRWCAPWAAKPGRMGLSPAALHFVMRCTAQPCTSVCRPAVARGCMSRSPIDSSAASANGHASVLLSLPRTSSEEEMWHAQCATTMPPVTMPEHAALRVWPSSIIAALCTCSPGFRTRASARSRRSRSTSRSGRSCWRAKVSALRPWASGRCEEDWRAAAGDRGRN